MAKQQPMVEGPPAFCFHQKFAPTAKRAMSFDRDYLMYAISGAIRLEVDGRRWIMPPSFAAWIPRKTEIHVEITQAMTCCSVLFVPRFVKGMPKKTIVFSMPSHARELVVFSRRWGRDSKSFDTHAEAIFQAIAVTCVEQAKDPSKIWFPIAQSAQVQRAIGYMQDNIAQDITLTEVATASGLSERTLLRRCRDELAMTWAQSLRQLRMIRAVEGLSQDQDQIVQIALACGYNSLSAFNKAFKTFVGLTPSEFRARFRGAEHPTETTSIER
jgi:AraC-like DNA-binding protein